MKEPTVSDMSIADEHIVVDAKSKVGDVCGKLSINPRNAVPVSYTHLTLPTKLEV